MALADLAPCVPEWVVIAQEEEMQVHKQILDSVVFLGWPSGNGFVAHGTAFVVTIREGSFAFAYFVTCKHVVEPYKDRFDKEPNDKPIYIRVNQLDGPPKTIKTICSDWICHADRFVDIAIYPFDVNRYSAEGALQLGLLSLPGMLPNTVQQQEIGVGDDIFIVGLFAGRVGERRNIPVVRLGSIAAMPLEPIEFGSPRKPAYLVETRSLGGTSGSPVFLDMMPKGNRIAWGNPPKNPDTGHMILPYKLLGMLIGSHSGRYREDFARHADDAENVIPEDAEFNAGISVMLPMSQVLEVIEQLKGHRASAVEERRKRSGFRPTSASRKRPPEADADSEANPMHREDFRTLLGGASKKTQQDD
jgi:hypothetical protein